MGSGVLVAIFGLLLSLAALPFGFPLVAAGLIMIGAGLFMEQPPPVTPEDPNMMFCWFCLETIPKDSITCPRCRMTQRPRG